MYKKIETAIDLSARKMTSLKPDVRGFICTCYVQCDKVITIEGLGRFCEHDARNIALEIIALVEGVSRVVASPKAKNSGWTYKEDQMIIDWYEKNDGKAKYGDHRIIAALLERPLSKTKAHIKYMKRMGTL